MNTAFTTIMTALDKDPIYWCGILVWALGFILYVRASFGYPRPRLGTAGSALCWLGFLLSVLAHFATVDASSGAPFALRNLDVSRVQNASTLIWALWVLGALVIVASWTRVVSGRAGWLGLCVALVAVLASWADEPRREFAIVISGLGLITILFLVWLKGGRLRRGSVNPGDYETELVRLCGGDRRKAARLIRDECKRNPRLSRAGAALAAVTRLRHERDPYPPPL